MENLDIKYQKDVAIASGSSKEMSLEEVNSQIEMLQNSIWQSEIGNDSYFMSWQYKQDTAHMDRLHEIKRNLTRS